MLRPWWLLLLCLLLVPRWLAADTDPPPVVAMGPTLADIRQKGDLHCGVSPHSMHFSRMNSKGEWSGFFVDLCRGLAAALLGNPQAVVFHDISPGTRFKALQERQVHIVLSNTTWTPSREGSHGVLFPAIYLYDGQGVAIHGDKPWKRLMDVDDKAVVCVEPNTTSYDNLLDWAKSHGKRWQFLKLHWGGILDGFLKGRCDLITDDRIALAGYLVNQSSDPGAYRLLEDTLSREPLGPVILDNDVQWLRIVRLYVHALTLAEEYNLGTRETAAALPTTLSSEARRLLGLEGTVGASLGLEPDWALKALRAVGHYGEIYQRHLGEGTPLHLPRGLNAPWSRGGMMYAPAFR
ncbi:MAG: transporter substrate-binding domain-containing protein [Magnetococcus sp. WYHC-3]